MVANAARDIARSETITEAGCIDGGRGVNPADKLIDQIAADTIHGLNR